MSSYYDHERREIRPLLPRTATRILEIGAASGQTLQWLKTIYPNAVTTAPSDSFPGLVAQVTGGSPAVTGVFYDDSYDRTYFAPGSNCQGVPGTEVSFAENVDKDTDRLDGGGTPGKAMTQIDLAKLPVTLVNGNTVEPDAPGASFST